MTIVRESDKMNFRNMGDAEVIAADGRGKSMLAQAEIACSVRARRNHKSG